MDYPTFAQRFTVSLVKDGYNFERNRLQGWVLDGKVIFHDAIRS